MTYTLKTPVRAWKVNEDGYKGWPEWVKLELARYYPMQVREDGVKIGNLIVPVGVWVVMLPNFTIDVRDEDDFRGRYEQA